MTHELIELGFADADGTRLTAVVAPLEGGSVHAFYSERAGEQQHWLRAADDNQPACFPMVPFCSRIRDGRFAFAGTDVCLLSDNTTGEHAIHGHGWRGPWRVVHRARARLVLEYLHPADAWPWSYVARQTLSMHAQGLQIELSVRNESRHVMPVGLGIHPYFPNPPGTFVRAGVEHWLRLDADLLPLGLEPLPDTLDLQGGLVLDDSVFDHVFTGWSGAARIEWPSCQAGLRLTRRGHATPNHLVLWVPADADFFCLEPVSNLPDGFNLNDTLPHSFVQVVPQASYLERWLLSPIWY